MLATDSKVCTDNWKMLTMVNWENYEYHYFA